MSISLLLAIDLIIFMEGVKCGRDGFFFTRNTKGEKDQLYMKIELCLLTVPKQPPCTALRDYVQISLVLLRYLLIKNQKDT